jgi:pre-mRNA-splicing factor CDC5/CEF1
MPCQWRSIAPLVGRTATQCLEHYERLLDAAQDRQLAPGDDPRRLRPGEIDPAPEAKPARPDPIDMDEDEKEMLSEARARLANTLGKKAKRKARERQLDEARRLAQIQKRREQKMAGIAVSRRRRDLKKERIELNPNEEIPFFKPTPAGLHDISAENVAQKDRKFQAEELARLEGVKRSRVAAADAIKDKEKMAKRKREALPDAIAQINAAVDTQLTARRRRARLALPRPVLDEEELERVAKATAAAAREANETAALADASAATSSTSTSLLRTPAVNSVGATPNVRTGGAFAGITAMRTPRVGAGAGAGGLDTSTLSRDDMIRREAQLLSQLSAQQTPLAGGESVSLQNADFGGITPAQRQLRTPNVLATPGGGVRMVGATPMRDALAINADDDQYASVAEQRAAQRRAAAELRGALAMLPAPTNEYELVVPDELPAASLGGDKNGAEPALELDEADRLAQLREHERRLGKLELERASSAVRRDLPRPLSLVSPAPAAPGRAAPAAQAGLASGALVDAAALIANEMRALLVREHVARPPTDGVSASKALRKEAAALAEAVGVDGEGVPRDVALNSALMTQARDLIEIEQGIVRGERGGAQATVGPLASLAAFREHLAGAHSSMWEPRSKRVVASDGGSASDVAAARRASAERAQAHALRLRTAATQLADEVAREQAAWQTRCTTLATQALQVRGESEEAWFKLEAFRAQAAQETRAIERRVARSKADVEEVARRELSQQAAFQVLSDRRSELLRVVE